MSIWWQKLSQHSCSWERTCGQDFAPPCEPIQLYKVELHHSLCSIHSGREQRKGKQTGDRTWAKTFPLLPCQKKAGEGSQMWCLCSQMGSLGAINIRVWYLALAQPGWKGFCSKSPTRSQWLEVRNGLACHSNLVDTVWCPSWGSWGEIGKWGSSLWIMPSVSYHIACLHQICIILPFLNSRSACTWWALMTEVQVPGEFWHHQGQLAAEKRFKGSKYWTSGSNFSVQEHWSYWLFHFNGWTNISSIIWKLVLQFEKPAFFLQCH